MFKNGEEVLIKAKVLTENPFDMTCACEIGIEGHRRGYKIPQECVIPGRTYEQGLAEGRKEGWGLAKRFVCQNEQDGITARCFSNAFGDLAEAEDVLSAYTYEEALAKIEAYERGQEIKVGDEVKTILGKINGIVTRVYSECCYVMWADGVCGEYQKSHLEKTGKLIDIESILKQIGE